jgi:glutamate dehydrogenase/leucine dehydrogenase
MSRAEDLESSVFADPLDLIDHWGPEKIVLVSDRRSGMRGVLVIDNTSRGQGKGGTRMSPTLTVSEVARLARTMTDAAAGMVDLDLHGARVGIQGFGAVGRATATRLVELGAGVVAVSTATGSVCDPDGLDVAALAERARALGDRCLDDHPGFSAEPMDPGARRGARSGFPTDWLRSRPAAAPGGLISAAR